MTSASDWPEPLELLNEAGASDIVLLCEHASNHIPSEYRRLGLAGSDLTRHIAWDIGAGEVARKLSALIDAPAFLGTYSRLLIDLNRPIGVETSIPVRSENTDIPGNAGIDAAEAERRASRVFDPFHERVSAHLDLRRELKRPTHIVAIHSFTPIFHGVPRPWHAGLLYGNARLFGEAIIAGLCDDAALNVGANVPYDVARDTDYTVPIHGDDHDLPAVLVEIRQDLLETAEGIDAWAGRLAACLSSLTSRRKRRRPGSASPSPDGSSARQAR